MTPEQAAFVRSYLLPQLRSEQAVTRRVIAAIPDGQGGFKPGDKARSAARVAWHIGRAEMWLLDGVIAQKFSEGDWTADDTSTGSAIAAWYEADGARRMAQVEALTPEQLATPVDWLGLRNDAAVHYLSLAIRHTVHHRGQLSAYLRAMGAKVPAIYVESADEPFTAGPEEIAAGKVARPPAF
jgi:uncharacterized damage-inducible protein DinB